MQEKSQANDQALAHALSSWAGQAPSLFESYQQADQTRLEITKSSLVLFESLQSESCARHSQAAEASLAKMIDLDVPSALRKFAASQARELGGSRIAIDYDPSTMTSRAAAQDTMTLPPFLTGRDRSQSNATNITGHQSQFSTASSQSCSNQRPPCCHSPCQQCIQDQTRSSHRKGPTIGFLQCRQV